MESTRGGREWGTSKSTDHAHVVEGSSEETTTEHRKKEVWLQKEPSQTTACQCECGPSRYSGTSLANLLRNDARGR